MRSPEETPPRKNNPKLTWVIVGGGVHRVEEYAGIPPGKRPAAFCPICKKLVILRFGNERVYHAAHRPDVVCAATQPETALHLNMKYHLRQELMQAHRLLISQSCSGIKLDSKYEGPSNRCEKSRSIILVSDWDTVQVEYPYQGLVLDVALLKNDNLVAAIEVCVTHRVDAEKKKQLNESSIPWVEVLASEDFYRGPAPWKAHTPLEPLSKEASSIEGTDWQCSFCLNESERLQKRIDAQRRPPKPKENIVTILRFVDFYYPSTNHFRDIYSLKRRIAPNGEVISAWIEVGDYQHSKPEIIKSARPPITDQTITDLKKEFHNRLKTYRDRHAIVDSPMTWHEWPRGVNHDQVFFEDYPFPKRYELSNHIWVKRKDYENLSWDGYWEDPINYLREQKLRQKIVDRSEVLQLPDTLSPPMSKPATCVHCGQETTDYWLSKDGQCRCRQCYRKGLY